MFNHLKGTQPPFSFFLVWKARFQWKESTRGNKLVSSLWNSLNQMDMKLNWKVSSRHFQVLFSWHLLKCLMKGLPDKMYFFLIYYPLTGSSEWMQHDVSWSFSTLKVYPNEKYNLKGTLLRRSGTTIGWNVEKILLLFLQASLSFFISQVTLAQPKLTSGAPVYTYIGILW